jgi:hypothetical protein
MATVNKTSINAAAKHAKVGWLISQSTFSRRSGANGEDLDDLLPRLWCDIDKRVASAAEFAIRDDHFQPPIANLL